MSVARTGLIFCVWKGLVVKLIASIKSLHPNSTSERNARNNRKRYVFTNAFTNVHMEYKTSTSHYTLIS